MDSHIGHGVSPEVGLGLKVTQISEGAQGPEVVPDVVDHSFFHFTFFVGASRIAGPGDNGKGAEEVQESGVEADDGSHALGDRRQHVVCNKLFWGPLEETKRIEKAAVEGFLSLAVCELQVENTAVAFQDRQAVEFALCIPIGDGSEVTPIHLALLPRQRLETDEGLSLLEGTSKRTQIVLEDGDASVKAQGGNALKDDGSGGLCVDLKKPADFFPEGVQLARPSYGRPLGVKGL